MRRVASEMEKMKEGYVETGKRKKERERASGEEKGCHGKSGKKKKV